MIQQPDYTEEFPESEWTIGSVPAWASRPIHPSPDIETFSWLIYDEKAKKEAFKKLKISLDFSDMGEEVCKRSLDAVPKDAILIKQDFEIFFGCDSFDEYSEDQIELKATTWYFKKKTEKQKKAYLKSQKAAMERERARKEKAEKERAAKEALEKALFLKLKKKYGDQE